MQETSERIPEEDMTDADLVSIRFAFWAGYASGFVSLGFFMIVRLLWHAWHDAG